MIFSIFTGQKQKLFISWIGILLFKICYAFVQWLFTLVCAWAWVRACVVALVAFEAVINVPCTSSIWKLVSLSVYFQMFPQTVWTRGCVITLIAFVWLFSTVYFQMTFQSTCPRRCKVTLVAFVCLFSTVYFQMFPQIASVIWCISILVAFVWFFSALCLSHWNLIGCDFTIISWFKILIHFQFIRSVLSLAILVSNWKHIGFGL